MQANKTFLKMPKNFWANVRTISQEVGYTQTLRGAARKRGHAGPIKVPTIVEITESLKALDLNTDHLVSRQGKPTSLGKAIVDYYEYRAHVLNAHVEPHLMNAEQAEKVFEAMRRKFSGEARVPMNKQSGSMKKPAFFTGIVNMIIEQHLNGLPCNYNPQELTTVTRHKEPFRTLARRVDGAFPGPVDPLAVWEIKEYYYTTTFGSRVADGVYETLLDGMELEELDAGLRQIRKEERVHGSRKIARAERRPPRIQHLLMVDAHYTWWVKGRSYLCRMIDMLHMGYVDEVLFGREVLSRLPEIVRDWTAKYEIYN